MKTPEVGGPNRPDDGSTDIERPSRALMVGVIAVVLLIVVAGVIGIGFAVRNGHLGANPTHSTEPPLQLNTVSSEIAAHYHFAASHRDLSGRSPATAGAKPRSAIGTSTTASFAGMGPGGKPMPRGVGSACWSHPSRVISSRQADRRPRSEMR